MSRQPSAANMFINGAPYSEFVHSDSATLSSKPPAYWKKRSGFNSLSVSTSTPSNLSDSDDGVVYSKIGILEGSDVDLEAPNAARKLLAAVDLREKYSGLNPRQTLWSFDSVDAFCIDHLPPPTQHKYELKDGIYEWVLDDKKTIVPRIMKFLQDYNTILDTTADGPVKTLSYKRLKILHLKYDLHVLMNGSREQMASQDDPKDFGNVIKVDTHIHLSAAMTSKHLLDFIRHKLRTSSTDVVMSKNGVNSTLQEVFNKLGISVDAFTLNSLDTRADNTFQRFDHFNAKYNPFGKSELREVFLKSNNFMGGKYYAELTQQLFDQMERSKFVAAEFRVSIYGSNPGEWDELAKWVINNKLYSDKQRWLIQVPRIFSIFRKAGSVASFAQLISNVFGPLFEVSVNPSSHPELHAFLNQVSGFDSVDDESKMERKFEEAIAKIAPQDWTSPENPPYTYYAYYFWANIVSLNQLRLSKGMKTFDFRPHCGESGDTDHLASAYLLATNISHGINLDKVPPLQYLYYLSQVGIAVSPLSNNSLFLEYALNPFPKFFRRGLNVSLSTDDPLQFHHTEQPLIEEYATAAQKWELGDGDLSEIARNSVLQSGFEHSQKAKWLGPKYLEHGVKGNDISFCNVPDIRIAFRQDNLDEENSFLKKAASIDTASVVIPKDIVEHTCKVTLSQPYFDENEQTSCAAIQNVLSNQQKYSMPYLTPEEYVTDQQGKASLHYFREVNGIIQVFEGAVIGGKQFVATEPLCPDLPSWADFQRDLASLVTIMKDPIVALFAASRMKLIDNKFGFHTLLNGALEKELMRFFPADYDHITKVDSHVRLQNSMSAKHFIRFVKAKLKNHSSDIVLSSRGRSSTLGAVYAELKIPIDNLTVDSLYVRADSGLAHLDASNVSGIIGNPSADNAQTALWHLYSLFLQMHNDIQGRYFAELAKEVIAKRARNPHMLHEFRLLHFAKSRTEWDDLAKWILSQNVCSPCVQWVIEIPQVYWYFKQNGTVKSLQTVIDNLFLPLLEVTQDPSSHPELAAVLPKISGFYLPPITQVLVDSFTTTPHSLPSEWTQKEQPTLPYLLYYIWANLYSLNTFRKSKKLPTLSLRSSTHSSAHSPEKASTWLLSSVIHNADIVLRSQAVLIYLSYLTQTSLSVSPLASNTRTHHYSDSLFFNFFRQGLKVSLGTDNPLMLHITNDPLSEEYAIASHMWKLSNCDLSEIARNSVLGSGFPHPDKSARIGESYWMHGVSGNCPDKTNVPNIRIAFRQATLEEERLFLSNGIRSRGPSTIDLQEYLESF